MGFAKTKEDLVSRSVSLSGIPYHVTSDQVKQAVIQQACKPIAVCKTESPFISNSSSTWLVLFQDHNMSMKFLQMQDLKCDFGNGPVKIEASTTIPCQIPNDWLDSSRDETDTPSSEQKFAYPPVPMQSQPPLYPYPYPHPYPYPYPHPQQQAYYGYPPRNVLPPPDTSGDFNSNQPGDHGKNPQYHYPPHDFMPQQIWAQETGALPLTCQDRSPMGPQAGKNVNPYSEGWPLMSAIIEAKHNNQQLGDNIVKEQEEYWEKINRKEEDECRSEPSLNEERKKETTMIKVTELPNGVTKDLLLNYFENKHRQGGGPVDDVELDMKNKTAIITFEDTEAVECVMQKCPHLLRKKQIDVEEFFIHETMANDEADEMEGASAITKIIVQNIPPSTSSDTLLNYFENSRRSGGGIIKNMEYEEGQEVAQITFEDESVVDGVINKSHKLDGCRVDVSVYDPPKPRPAHGNRSPEQGLTGAAATNVMYGEEEFEGKPEGNEEETKKETTMIKVTELPDGVTEDLLLNYFENKRRQGGGPVEDVDLDIKSKTAIITFEETEAVERVMQKCPHLLRTKQIDVEEFFIHETMANDEADEMEGASAITKIIVQNIPLSTSYDTVSNYFENSRRSGGGLIKNMEYDEEQGVAQITFEDEYVIDGVISKSHKLDGSRVDVSVYVPPKPRPTYGNKLLVRRLNVDTTKDCLCNFLEAKTGVAATDVMYGEEATTALVTFEGKPDIKKLQNACEKRTLEGVHLLVSIVSVSNCVHITEFSPKSSEDTLTFYFENPKHGGDIEKVDFRKDEKFCLIYFKDYSVVESVCKKPHKIDGETLTVKMFHDCLGPGAEDEGQKKFKLPNPLIVSDQDPNKIQFVKTSPLNKEAVEKQMKQCYAMIAWPQKQTEPLLLHCTLTKDIKGWNKLVKDWEKTVRENLIKFMDMFMLRSFTVLQELWQSVITEMGSLSVPHPEHVAVYTSSKTSNVTVCGMKHIMENVANQIEKIITDVETEIERKKQQIKESMTSLKPFQLKMLLALRLPNKLEKKYKELKVRVTFEKMEVLFEGASRDIKAAQLDIFQKMQKMIPSKLPNLSLRKIQFMRSRQVKDYVISRLREENVIGVWNVDNNKVCVYGMSDSDAVKVAHLVKDSIVECVVDIEEESILVLSSPKWQQIIQDAEQNNAGLVKIHTEIDQLKLFIVSTDNLASGILEIVTDFLKFNTIKEILLSYQNGVLRFLQTYNHKDIEDCERNLQPNYVKISIIDNEIAIKGTEDGLNKAKYRLNQLADQVLKCTHMLSLPGIPKYISSEKGKERLLSIESSNNCIIDVNDSSGDSDEGFKILEAPPSTTLPGQKVYAICSPQTGVNIYVLEGDMTELKVDVIVNAANPELEHAGGLAKNLVDKGGKVIQEECREHVRKYKKLLDGAVFCSSAGNLKCQAIVHAVGPRWQGGGYSEKDVLDTAIYRALEETVDHNFTSIAFPALSSGVYGFPVDLCTKIIVKAIKDHLKKNTGVVKEIYLCDMKSNTVLEFTQALMHLFGRDTVTVGQGGQRAYKAVSAMKPTRNTPRSYANVGDKRVGSKPRQFGNVKVKIVKGEIANQQVDVIVNTTSKDLNLNTGAVSKSLLTVAGRQLQQECQQNYPGGVQSGQVAQTGGGNLRCRLVLHGSLSQWNPNGSSIQILVNFMTACLKVTVDNGMSTISFPALGTGNLGFPRDVVAEQMFTCVSKFATSNPTSSVNEVRFVVYPGDTATVKAFEMEDQAVDSESASDGGRRWRRQFSTQESESGASNSARIQHGRDEQSMKIGNISLKIFSGDIITTNVDCIVNGSNTDLDLTQGAVSQAILKAGGTEIQRQCSLQKKHMEHNGYAVTTAGNLACKWIIHVAAPGGNSSSVSAWRKVIKYSLKAADSISVNRIAFPLLGQSYQMTVEESAKALTEAVFDFSQSSQKHVHEVNVVVYDKKNIAPYAKSVTETLVSYTKSKQGAWGKFTSAVSDWIGSSSKNQDSVEIYKQKDVNFTIYGSTQMDIDSAVKHIEKLCDSEVIDKVLKDDSIRDLTQMQVGKIKQLQSKWQIYIELEERLGRIRIQGIANDVMNANDDIHSILKEAEKLKYQTAEAGILTKIVQWYCIDETKSGQKLVPYDSMINLKIENAFVDKSKDVRFRDEDGTTYVVDFVNMKEYDMQNPSDVVSIIRRDQLKDSSSEIPSNWVPMRLDENLKIVQLRATDQMYQTLVQHIAPLGIAVIKIEQIQNQTLYKQYAAKKKLMEQTLKGTVFQRHLWHGTSLEAVDCINTHGFNRSYCGKNATAFGGGVYFAVNPSYSASNTYSRPDVSGYKRMYYSLVLTGDFTTGSPGMRVPPPKNPAVPHVLFDCVTDNMTNPGMFVIFHDTQAYPEYLVTFQ